MREMGEGIRRISALMNGHDLALPDIDSSDHSFLMTFSHRNIFNPVEQRWLGAFESFHLSREEKFAIRTPDISKGDHREVVHALASLGPLKQITNASLERIRNGLSGQNIYRDTATIRRFLR